MRETVYVEVTGLTGSGKSAVMGEIEIALKALGLKVGHGVDFQAEKNGTHADWQQALDLYKPTVVLIEHNISRQPQAREEAQPVAWCCPEHLTRIKRQAEARGEASSTIYGYPTGTYQTPLYTTPPSQPLAEGADAEKLRVGEMHTIIMERIHEELVNQHPDAFTEDGDIERIIPSGCTPQSAFVKIDVSALADVALAALQQEGRAACSAGKRE